MKGRNLSGADLARFAGVSRQYVSMIRSGETRAPGAAHADAIERVIGVEHGSLFQYADEPAVPK